MSARDPGRHGNRRAFGCPTLTVFGRLGFGWPILAAFAKVGIALLLMALPALPQSKPSEYAVKAAYLYNFGKFVRWPVESRPGRSSNFSICILGEDPFGATLDATVDGENIAGKPIVVKRVASAREGSTCNILYISSSERARMAEILSAVGKDATLTVSDLPGFADRGGMVEFVFDSGRVRFDINLEAAQSAGLNLSSELLKVAMNVKGH